MNGTLFQLSSSPIPMEDWLTEELALTNILDSLGENAAEYIELYPEEGRASAINNLVKDTLPIGMFELGEAGTLTYKGGFHVWVSDTYIPKIKEAANALVNEKAFGMGIGSAYDVEKAVVNPFNTDSLFVISNDTYYSRAMRSGDFMGEFVNTLAPGATIYIGAVFDYHY